MILPAYRPDHTLAELTETFLNVEGTRYEYETNVLLDLVKHQGTVREETVATIYRDRENSTSHFRVLWDSVRICKDLLKFSLLSFSSFIIDYKIPQMGIKAVTTGGGRAIFTGRWTKKSIGKPDEEVQNRTTKRGKERKRAVRYGLAGKIRGSVYERYGGYGHLLYEPQSVHPSVQASVRYRKV